MTDEGINRKFDVVAGHSASLAVGLQALGEAQRRAEARIDRAEARWGRTEASTRNLPATAELHEQEAVRLRGAQGRTDERLNILVGVVERYVGGRRGAGEKS